MMAKQQAHFDQSMKEVHKTILKRIKETEQDMNNDIAEVKVCFDKMESYLDSWFVKCGQEINLTMAGLKSNQTVLQNIDANAQTVIEAQNAGMHHFDEQMVYYSNVITTEVLKEVRKGEVQLQTKVDALEALMKDQFKAANIYCYDNFNWLHRELFPGSAEVRMPKQVIPDPIHDFVQPAQECTQFWTESQDQSVVGAEPDIQIVEESPPPAHKRRRYGEDPPALRSDSNREIDEVWSPISKSIILDTFKLVDLANENRWEHYGMEE
ncbi:hypothetical protein KSP39_PZI012395 [Platanthera zijinensis]|uniref:Uncharacterized protein n=1 Tax=Platanthera zijinensis TaxID=2320716 RepID=A0AAP0G4M6_9ASPA